MNDRDRIIEAIAPIIEKMESRYPEKVIAARIADVVSSLELSQKDKAKLELLEDWKRMAIWFDGGPVLMSHEQMHKFHKDEPYIGCVFCRDKFMLKPSETGECHS